MSKQLHWKKLAAPSILQIILRKKQHIQCKVKKSSYSNIVSKQMQKKKKKKVKQKNKMLKRIGIQINMTKETKNTYNNNNELD